MALVVVSVGMAWNGLWTAYAKGMRLLKALAFLALAYAGVWSVALAEEVPTHDFFRITQTTSRSTTTPGAWRYLIVPRTKEARRYWAEVTGDWIRSLRIGLPVRFGPLEIELTQEKTLRLLPGCKRYHPRCYSRPALPPGMEGWKLDLILVDFHNALVWTLEDARKHARTYPATVAVSKFVRLHVNPEGVFLAEPLGWKP